MIDGPNFVAGRHEAMIETLSSDMTDVKAAVARIEISLAEKRGERRVATWFAATGGGAMATLFGIIARHYKL